MLTAMAYMVCGYLCHILYSSTSISSITLSINSRIASRHANAIKKEVAVPSTVLMELPNRSCLSMMFILLIRSLGIAVTSDTILFDRLVIARFFLS